jgi:4-diphosphocytidyl-2-C-methyl-D-erythritol kinase
MILFPNCKINLGLFVTSKREDGFHNIESLFLPVPWCDVLEVLISDDNDIQLEVIGTPIDADVEDNIVVKAYRLLQKDFGIGGVKVKLWKRLPTGAGLGGGSANGAFMLKAINEIFELNLESSKLKEYAAKLGSDCPFFIDNSPAFVSGRGEVMEAMKIDFPSLYIAIVPPGIHVSTPKAYSMITPKSAPVDLLQINDWPLSQWQSLVTNDFETPVVTMFPRILEIKKSFQEMGAIYASMSGSGSAVFAFFENEPNAHSVREKMQLSTSVPVYIGKFPASEI